MLFKRPSDGQSSAYKKAECRLGGVDYAVAALKTSWTAVTASSIFARDSVG